MPWEDKTTSTTWIFRDKDECRSRIEVTLTKDPEHMAFEIDGQPFGPYSLEVIERIQNNLSELLSRDKGDLASYAEFNDGSSEIMRFYDYTEDGRLLPTLIRAYAYLTMENARGESVQLTLDTALFLYNALDEAITDMEWDEEDEEESE